MLEDFRFDHLTRLLATSAPRRLVSGALIGGGLATLLGAKDAIGKKKKKKKQRKPSGCTPSCFNKVCGQADGCRGKCSVQAGCGSDESCINGACAANVCDPACTGNHVCQPDASCACPQGLKECASGGSPGYCHECCFDEPGTADQECNGSAGGPYCRAHEGLVNRCDCFSRDARCPNGTCGTCCRLEDCFLDVFGTGPVDTGRDCVVVNQATGEYGCRCRSGTYACPHFTFCAEPGNVGACGVNCDDCNRNQPYQNYVCEGNPERCCLPTGSPCALDNQRCCSGSAACVLNDQGTTYVCA